jgi:hypothetical protein
MSEKSASKPKVELPEVPKFNTLLELKQWVLKLPADVRNKLAKQITDETNRILRV